MKVRMHITTLEPKPHMENPVRGIVWAFFCAIPVWALLIWLALRAL